MTLSDPDGPPRLVERLLLRWSDPEQRGRLLFWANLLAFLMFAGGMVLLVLLLVGWPVIE